MLRDSLTALAVDPIGIEQVLEPFQARRIVGKVPVEVENRVVLHGCSPYDLGISYHEDYLLSRDSYLY
jgi:hypothetical protein